MSKSVLSDRQYQYSDQGYVVDNVGWQDEIKRRLWEDAQAAATALAPAEAEPTGFQAFTPDSLSPEEVAAEAEAKAAEEAEALRIQTEEKLRQIEEAAQTKGAEIEMAAKAEAEKIVSEAREKARSEAEKIKSDAEAAGRQEGHAAGYEAGMGEGKQEGLKAYSGVVENLSSVFQKAVEERKELLGEMKPMLVELVGEALQACLKKKAKNGQIVVHFVEEALKKAQGRVKLVAHLHPADVEAVETQMESLQLSVGAGEIELVPDARIEQGGCLLETEAGSIDTQLSTVVAQVKDALNDEDGAERGMA